MPRSAKLLLTGVILFLVAVPVAVAAVILFRVPIANLAMPGLLADAGYPGGRTTVTELGPHRTVLTDVHLVPGNRLAAARVEIDYRPLALLSGRLDAVTVSKLRLDLGLTAHGIDWGPLAPLMVGRGGDRTTKASPVRLVGPLRFDGAEVVFATPWGEVTATLDGKAVLTDNLGTTVAARLGLVHPDATLDGTLSGHFDEDGHFGARLDITGGASRAATLAFTTLTGHLAVRGSGLADLAVSGRLAADQLHARGLALGDGRLSGSVDGGRLDVSLVLPGAPGGLEATAHVQSPNVAAADPVLEVAGDAAAAGLSGDLAPWPGVGLDGRVVYHVTSHLSGLEGVAAALAGGARLPAAAGLTARLDADLVEVSLERRGTVIAARGGLVAKTAGGRLDVRLAKSAHLDIDQPTPGLKEVAVDVSPAADGAPLLKLGPTLGDPVEAAASLSAQSAGLPTLSGTVAAALQVGAGGTPFLEDLRADLAPVSWRLPWGEVSTAASTLHLQGTPDAFSGRLATSLDVPRLAIGGLRARGLHLPLALTFDGNATRIETGADGCLTARVERIEAARTTLTTAPLPFCPVDAATPLVRLVRGESPRLQIAAALTPVEAKAVLHDATGHETARVTGSLPRLDGRLTADLADGTWAATVGGNGGELDLAPASVTLKGLAFTLDAARDGLSLKLTRAAIEDAATRSRFAPLHLTGIGGVKGGEARMQGRLTAAGGKLGLDLAASDDLATGDGRLSFKLPTVDLSTAGIQVETVAPILAGLVTRLRGRASAEGEIAWQKDGIAGSTGELTLDDLAFATMPAEVAGLKGTIAFSSLLPLATPPGQRLDVGFLDPGLPLANGEVTFQVKPGPVIAIDRAGWPFAGGRLVSHNIEIDPRTPFKGATLEVENVSVADLMKIADVKDLSGSGALSGRLPLVMKDGTPTIEGAKLSAGKGVIRYTNPEAAALLAGQSASAGILTKALKNFHYDRLELTAEGPLTGGITAGVHLGGANPELYGGQPIQLNVSLQGDLRQLIRSASVIKGLPESIRRQIEGGGNAAKQ